MKKMSLAVLTCALVLLPGCCRNKKNYTSQSTRKNISRIETSMYPANDSEITEEIEENELDSDDIDETLNIDDIDALLKEMEEDENGMSLDGEDLAGLFDEYSDNDQAFNWVEDQADDELKKLYFSFNHYGIREDQKDALTYDIEQVKQFIAQAGTTEPTIIIEGHACQEGSPSYNIGLSEKRATNVADLFVAAGIDRNLIKVVGRGQEFPEVVNGAVINGSREQRAPNRRVEVRVIYT